MYIGKIYNNSIHKSSTCNLSLIHISLLCKVAATGCIHKGERYTKSKDTELRKISYIKNLYLSNTCLLYTSERYKILMDLQHENYVYPIELDFDLQAINDLLRCV